jgi:hypothetical protein
LLGFAEKQLHMKTQVSISKIKISLRYTFFDTLKNKIVLIFLLLEKQRYITLALTFIAITELYFLVYFTQRANNNWIKRH